ncbi:winged helix-turn-helix transcriptional regulator [Nocardia sp. NPDC058658]|uniref:winged helix-turn-helix transcriptional regulator n=1 Tax=Nocardia sp. NPDC058658 TaxID=3346580 RepID=UPI00364F7BA3
MAAVMEGPLADLSRWNTEGCSIARAMDLIGTRSAMLILREAYYGTRRFDGFARRVGITDAAASAQLRKLTTAGLLEKRPYQEEGKRTRHEYTLTQMGRDLLPAVVALWQWGDTYLQPGPPPLLRTDTETGAPVRAGLHTPDGTEIPLERLAVRVNDDYLRDRKAARERK